MRLLPLFIATLGLAASSGCVAYHARDLNPAATQAQLESRSLQDRGLEQFLAAHGQSTDGDWDLAKLTLAAFYFTPELDVARAQLAEAEAEIRAATARPNPTFTFTPGYNQDSAPGITPWILEYALDVPIELRARRTYRSAEARQKAEAARFDLAQAAWAARSATRRALSELHAAEATAALWRTHRPLLTQAAQLVELQVQAGEVSPFEAGQSRIAANRAELAARDSERLVIAARSRLAEAIGIPLAALADVPLSYRGLAPPAGPVAAAEARRWAAQNRADLLSALANYAAVQSALQLEIARQYPDLNVGPGYQLDQGEGKWSLGLAVTLPLFDRNRAPIAAAEAKRDAAAARFLALQNRIMAEVDRAAADYASALGDLDVIQKMRAALELQTRTIQAQQAAGETTRLDLTRSQIEFAETSRAELEASLRAEQAIGAFEDAVQRPLAWPESAWRNSPRNAAP